MKVKNQINDLGIFGGQPSFTQALHVGRPNVGSRQDLMQRMHSLLDRGWLTNHGPVVKEFEQSLAEILNVKHCITTCNATMGLMIVARALELQGEVIMPAFTFAGTAHALEWNGITPIFCDLDPATYTIDPAKIEKLITAKTTAIVGVHIFGRPGNIEALEYIAKQHGLKLVFDAAHAFGCSYRKQMLGKFGDAEVFSFHATKFLNTFEGGMIATNHDALAEKIRSMLNFGFGARGEVEGLGINGKMTEVSAAMGLSSLAQMHQFIAVNYQNYCLYAKLLADIPGVRLIQYDAAEKNNYHYINVEIEEKTIGLTRDKILNILHAENILAKRYFFPGVHQVEPYCSLQRYATALTATDSLVLRVMQLPTGTSIGEKEIQQICAILRLISVHGFEISTLLEEEYLLQT